MVTSLFDPGSPPVQLPATLQLPLPPFQVTGLPGFCTGGPSGPASCDNRRLPTPPVDTLLPASGRPPFWSDESFPSLDPLLRWNFLVAAKPAVTKRATQRVTASDVRFTVCLLSGSGRNLSNRVRTF